MEVRVVTSEEELRVGAVGLKVDATVRRHRPLGG
jgi:hypothetical protein